MTRSNAASKIYSPQESERLLRRWLGEVPIFLAAAILFAVCVTLLTSHGVAISHEGVVQNARLFLAFGIAAIFIDFVWQLFRQHPERPFAFLWSRYSAPTARIAVAKGLPLLAVAVLALPFFSKMKAAIPLFTDYTWDAAFIAWDRAIFLGHDPWLVMQPLLGFPIVSAFLALMYHLWFLLLYPGVMFFAFAKMDNSLRRQFFLSYVLSWSLVGGLMATMLASVGPCFLEPLLGNNHYAEQMAYLYAANEQVPIMVLNVQELLLEWHGRSESGLGSGITAMPSMHCAIAFLYWIAVRRISARWGAFFGVFFFMTWISSVHLAYHYAVDGLVSLIAVAAIWAASERTIAAWDAWLARQFTLRTNTVPAE